MSEMMQAEEILKPAAVSKWKHYPAYRDSDVEWLGEIPAHWEVRRLRFMCQLSPPKSELSSLPVETVVSFLPMERIGEDGSLSLEETRRIDQVLQGYTYFRNNDVVVAKITPCFENGKGAYCKGLLGGIAFGTTELHVLRPKKDISPKFVYYLTITDAFRRIGTAWMQGAAGQQRVQEDFVSNFRTGIPPYKEQHAIAAFLDRETAHINTLVAKKERLIELLQEKRAALFSHAVTKGLDAGVRMRDSGVEWLGEMPVHWEVRRLKFVAAILGGGTPSKDNLEYWVGDIPWVSPKDMKDEVIRDSEDHITVKAIEQSATRLVSSGAVLLVVRSGILRHSIPVAINICPVAINQDIKAIMLDSSVRSEYFANLVRGYQNALLVEWRKEGATVESIEIELLANTMCPIPPLAEQNQIVSYLRQETAKIDALIAGIREGIEKLREYRVALIAAAVTGKIDVRGKSENRMRCGGEEGDHKGAPVP